MKARLIWGGTLIVVLCSLVVLALGLGHSTPADAFGLSGYGGVAFAVAAVAFATVGALVSARVSGNRIGPVFCLMGAILAIGDFTFQYADRALFISPGTLPGASVAAWLQNFGLPPAFGLLGLTLLLFPDGRLPSRRWRPAAWLALTGIALNLLGYGLRPGPLDAPFATVTNPLGVPGTRELMDALSGFGWMFMGASVALAAAAAPIRLGQARVLALGFAVFPLAIAVSTLAVAALFRPARARIQGTVDRRFYRSRYHAARTLEVFAGRLRAEVDLDALQRELVSVVGETVQPARVALWLPRNDSGTHGP